MKLSIAAHNDEIVSFVEFRLETGIDQLSSPFLGSFGNKLAMALEIPLEDVHILGFRPGTDLLVAFTRFAVNVPDTLRDRFIYYQLQGSTPWMKLPERLTFISHSPGDSKAALEMHEFLRSHKFNPWLDRESILPGERRLPALLSAIRSSTAFVYCLSRNSMFPRRTLLSEVQAAERLAGIPLEDAFFVVTARVDDCTCPPHFMKYPLIDWDNGRNRHKLLDVLSAWHLHAART